MRSMKRNIKNIRPVKIIRNFTKHAEGSVLIEFGDTKILCTATVEEGVPRFLKGSGQGWITAEYSMLPRATHNRNLRESTKGKQNGRTIEIQRMISRSLRAVVDLTKLGDYTITLDCDVLQADGGTRTASITGSCVALVDALNYMQYKKILKTNPMRGLVAAVSVGIVSGISMCDLEYIEDSIAETDINVVMTEDNHIVEIQGTAESKPFNQQDFINLINLAQQGIAELIKIQKIVLSNLKK